MDKIGIHTLQIGKPAKQDLLSINGDLLVKKGVLITQKHLDLFKRRNIANLYSHSDDEEMRDLLALEELDTFELDDTKMDHQEEEIQPLAPLSPLPIPSQKPFGKPEKLLDNPLERGLPNLANMASGEKGLEIMNESVQASNLDRSMQEGSNLDIKPIGPSMLLQAASIYPKDRTEVSKSNAKTSHLQYYKNVENIFKKILMASL